MDDWASLRALNEIDRNSAITQRELSRRIGVSLGMTNLLLRRMARKAWIKIRSVPGRRLLYAITPRGIAEKFRKARDFVTLSLGYYKDLKRTIGQRLAETGRSRPRVVFYGNGELSAIVAEAVREIGGTLVSDAHSAEVVLALEKPPGGMRSRWEAVDRIVIDLS